MRLRDIVTMNFVRLWTGNTASGVATWALPFVLGLIVLDGQLSAEMLGLILAVRTGGFLAAVPVAGVLADRVGPRRIILLSGVSAAVGTMLTWAGFLGADAPATIVILVGAILAGMGQGACRPAYQAVVPAVVPPESLQPANAAMSLSVRVTSLLGPAAATAIAVGFGSRAALLVIALLWLASAFLPPFRMISLRPDRQASSLGIRDFGRELLEGIAEARRHPWFMAGLVALTCVISTGYSVTAVLLPLVSRQSGDGSLLMTASVTAYTLGALIGAVLLTRWKPANVGWTALVGLALYALVPFGLLAPVHIAVPVAAYFVAGVAIEIFNVPWFTSVQREVPPERLSRVSSIDFLVSYGLAPVGLAIMAPAVAAFGLEAVLLVSGVICLLVPLAAMCVPSTRHFSRRAS